MLVQRSGSQTMACRQHRPLKLGLTAKYKLPAAHHLLSGFAYGSAKSQVSGLTSKYSASFEEAVNITCSIISFQINIYLFFRLLSALSLFIDVTLHYSMREIFPVVLCSGTFLCCFCLSFMV